MAIHPDGRFAGSVSGGCVEDDLVQRVLRGEFERKPPRLLEYGISTGVTRRVGLPCGGRLELIVEYIDAPAPLAKVFETINARQRICRRVCLATGEASLHPASDCEAKQFDGENLYKVFGPAWRLLIIGAGELARRVAQLALTLDFAVTLCDSRPEYAEGWEVDACEFVSTPAAEFLPCFAPDEHSVVLALAHAPAIEDQALALALNSDAFYVGALGSLNNAAARRKRLLRLGVDETRLSHLHGPVGLDIGSRTPAEIAISIGAALIEAREKSAQAPRRAQAAGVRPDV